MSVLVALVAVPVLAVTVPQVLEEDIQEVEHQKAGLIGEQVAAAVHTIQV